jgi:UDP-N-acetylglucosamine 2-epimerase
MMQLFREELGLDAPTISLNVRATEPAVQTAKIVEAAARSILNLCPNLVCVFGDTNSSLAVALAAVKCQVPVAHIEAGCRSFDHRMQEEHNRRLIDHMSTLLMPVSPNSEANLLREAVPGAICQTGDPQYDIFLATQASGPCIRLSLEGRVGLLTLHRPENVDDTDALEALLKVIGTAGKRNGVRWIFPAHPRTAKVLPAGLNDSIEVVEPLSYREILAILESATICVTDSGGLQKDAFWSGVPTVTVRPSTEWTETVELGFNVLAPTPSALDMAIDACAATTLTPSLARPYGDGHASEKVVSTIDSWLQLATVSPSSTIED